MKNEHKSPNLPYLGQNPVVQVASGWVVTGPNSCIFTPGTTFSQTHNAEQLRRLTATFRIGRRKTCRRARKETNQFVMHANAAV